MVPYLLAAFAAMIAYGSASVLQAYAARRASGPAVLRHPAYLAGLACDGVAWGAQVVAMWQLPLFTVQGILAGSLAVTMLIGIPTLGLRPTRLEWLGVALTSVGVGIVSMTAGEGSAVNPGATLRLALVATLIVTVIVGALSYRRGGMITQGAVAGVGYGLSALFVRVTMAVIAAGGAWYAIPELYLAFLSGGAGIVMYARALEHHRVGPPTALLWVIEVIGPGLVGLALLGDAIRDGWTIPAALAVLAALAGCVVLALGPSQPDAGAEPTAVDAADVR